MKYENGQQISFNNTFNMTVLSTIYPYVESTGRALYQAKDTATGLHYAMKVFDLQSNTLKDIQREIVALNKLDYPSLFPRAISLFKNGQHAVLLMDWMTGKTMEDVFPAAPQDIFDLKMRFNFFLAACYAVQKIHDARLIHRDLKPANILLKNPKDPSKGVAIIDFGLCAAIRNLVEGSLSFQPPEQDGSRHLNLAYESDIFSIAQIGWKLFTGNIREVYINFDTTDWDSTVPNLTAANPQLPEKLNQILSKAMAFQPKHRYRSMNHMMSELKGVKL